MHIVTDYYIGIVQCQASVKTYLEAEGGGEEQDCLGWRLRTFGL